MSRTTRAATAYSAARVVLGAALCAAPARLGRLWLGPVVTDNRAARVAVRSMGARDALFGLGALLGMRKDAPVRGWLEAAAAADAIDAFSTLAAGNGLPVTGRVLVPAFALAGAATGAWLAGRAGDGTTMAGAGIPGAGSIPAGATT